MRCEAAQNLFDAYLDGELSSSQRTELGAHCVKCPDCRRALALLEVSGHILTSDQEPVSLEENFTDRLLACVDEREASWMRRGQHWLYVAGPLAAAAAVVLMGFFGFFDSNKGRVAGKAETGQIESVLDETEIPEPFLDADLESTESDAPAGELEHLIRQSQDNFDTKRQDVESLLENFDLTILQKIDVLEQMNEPTPSGAAGEDTGRETESDASGGE